MHCHLIVGCKITHAIGQVRIAQLKYMAMGILMQSHNIANVLLELPLK